MSLDAQTPADQDTAKHSKKLPSKARKPLIVQTSGRRYFDSGEFALMESEGRLPDDVLPPRNTAAPAASTALLHRWKSCGTTPTARARPGPSRLSACSPA